MVKQKTQKIAHMNVRVEPKDLKTAKKCAIDLGITLQEYVRQAIGEKNEINTGHYN